MSLILLIIFDTRKFLAKVVSSSKPLKKRKGTSANCWFLMSMAFLQCSCWGCLGKILGIAVGLQNATGSFFYVFGQVFRMTE